MFSQFRVLLVDDNPDKRQLLTVALEAAGYSVLTAVDGVEGLAMVESEMPDLIVTDVMMPQMDGYEMARRVRANPATRFIPIIIQTFARDTTEDARRGAEVGALGYITDPTDLGLLLARVRTLLDFKNYLDSAEEAAFTDHLTRLANSRRFERQLEREVARALRYSNCLCLLLLEVDNFVTLNEIHGRDTGDEVLRRVARSLMAGIRGIDTAARLDAGLFAILLPEECFERGNEVAERLYATVKALEVLGLPEQVMVSIGVAEFTQVAQDGAARDGAGLLAAAHQALRQEKRSRKAAFQKAVAWVMNFVRAKRGPARPPTCFISYAWSTPENNAWVAILAKDLNEAGIETLLDRRDNAAIGSSISRFVGRIETSDFIIIVGTPLYREKYENLVSSTGSVAAAEVDLINTRLLGTEAEKNSVLPLLREGAPKSALPPLMRGRVYGNFQAGENYFANLFDLILTIHSIPFNNPEVEDLRESLRRHIR